MTLALYIIVFGILGVLCFGWFFLTIGRSIYHLFDHTKWDKSSMPDLNAKIIDIHTEKVIYIKNGAKFKTTISFSDGFHFITHKTNREDEFFTYHIAVDKSLMNEIIEKSILVHKKAVLSYNFKKRK